MSIVIPLLPRKLRWLIVVLIAGFIFYVSIFTVPPETIVDRGQPDLLPLDKWRHFVAYGVLGYSIAYATADYDTNVRTEAVLVIGAVVAYGLGIEFGQSQLPNRFFSLGDAYANALGGLLLTPWYLVNHRLEFVSMNTAISLITGRHDS